MRRTAPASVAGLVTLWSRLILLVVCSILVGCAAGVIDDDGTGTLTHADPRTRDCPQLGPPSWLGFDPDGRLVRFDGTTGATTRLGADHQAAFEGLRDVSVDCLAQRAFVYLEQGDQEGELIEYDLAPERLGASRHRADIDGWVRSLPLGEGVLLFEVGYGQRWRVLRDDGEPTASQAVPMPRSLWLSPDGRSLDVVLLREGAASATLSWGRASLHDDSFGVDHEQPVAWGTAAQLAQIRATRRRDGMLAAVVEGGQLLLAQLRPDADATLLASLSVGAGMVEQITALEPNAYDDRFLVLLREPAQLVAVSLTSGSSAVVSLPAPVSGYAPLFSRALVTQEHRVWVATNEGVEAYDWLGGDQPRLRRDTNLDGQSLRGPLAGPVPSYPASP